jgi:flagellar motor switch protein FliG
MQPTLETPQELNKLQKVAALLRTLGPEKSVEVLSHLESHQVERIAAELERMGQLDSSTKRMVLDEFRRRCAGLPEDAATATDRFERSSIKQPAGDLGTAVGKAPEAKTAGPEVALGYLQDAEVDEIVGLIKDEHPQIIAFVLCNLPAPKAASMLGKLPESLRAEAAWRVANSSEILPGVAERLARALQQKASSLKLKQAQIPTGQKVLMDILENVDPKVERAMLKSLAQQDPDLGRTLCSRLFDFNDLIRLDQPSLQAAVRKINWQDLRLALKGSEEEVREALLQSLPEADRQMLLRDLETGQPARLREIRAAQGRSFDVLRKMVDDGTAKFVTKEV